MGHWSTAKFMINRLLADKEVKIQEILLQRTSWIFRGYYEDIIMLWEIKI